ncbi:pancreatic triacylglycerol lipase-like isoform X7 [Cylas formicarius]|uniref:pancreatic triacylglycerol lipase-like isoform X7 n=1 Tax=Cylas formicarius TaxID=197179 RepID=UPI0029583365|nr:pancreatic triacylglycerol lipase-like isoform X7 [Cylas formicarius]
MEDRTNITLSRCSTTVLSVASATVIIITSEVNARTTQKSIWVATCWISQKMKSLVIFLAAFACSSALPDDIYNPGYLLYQREDGLIEVEDLNNATIQVYATEADMTFHFFDPSNPSRGTAIKSSQIPYILSLTGFDNRRDTLVIIHGWRNHYQSPVNDIIKNAALSNHNLNVIVVDWSPIAGSNYLTAQRAVTRVGQYVGTFLTRLESQIGLSLARTTIVGHSLGAHITGNAGAATRGRIRYLVGLDPAGPLFSERDTSNRLDPTDGQFVQVIHTNDGVLGFGINMGHADYFPNGGKTQPGCGIDVAGSCAHSRAYEYYAESLFHNFFNSRQCNSYSDFTNNICSATSSRMGGLPLQNRAGIYFLRTNSRPLYA